MIPHHFCHSVLIVFVLLHEGRPFLDTAWKASTLMKCLFSSKTKISELTSYAPGENISDNILCFFKCFLESSGVLENGKIVPGKLEGSSMLPSIPQDLSRNLEGCLEDIGEGVTVAECRDLVQVKDCVDEFYVGYQSGKK